MISSSPRSSARCSLLLVGEFQLSHLQPLHAACVCSCGGCSHCCGLPFRREPLLWCLRHEGSAMQRYLCSCSNSQLVHKRPKGATLPSVAVRHLQVFNGFDDVRGQYVQLFFHVVHERRCNCKHGFLAIHLDYLGLAPPAAGEVDEMPLPLSNEGAEDELPRSLSGGDPCVSAASISPFRGCTGAIDGCGCFVPWSCVWPAGGCERVGAFVFVRGFGEGVWLCIFSCWGRCDVSVTEET